MSELPTLRTLFKSLRGESKGKQFMLVGVILVILSGYLPTSNTHSLNSANITLCLGVFTFVLGVHTYANEKERRFTKRMSDIGGKSHRKDNVSHSRRRK
jgi:hypothetical protein